MVVFEFDLVVKVLELVVYDEVGYWVWVNDVGCVVLLVYVMGVDFEYFVVFWNLKKEIVDLGDFEVYLLIFVMYECDEWLWLCI